VLVVWIDVVTRRACFARPFTGDSLGVEGGGEVDGVGLGVMAGGREGKRIVVEDAGERHVRERKLVGCRAATTARWHSDI